MLKHKLIAFTAVLPLALGLAAAGSAPARTEPAAAGFAPGPELVAATRWVYGILSDRRYVYRPKPMDDAYSADIHRRYLESMDGQKLFFTRDDITRLEVFRT